MIFLIILFLFSTKPLFAIADLQITLAPTNLIVGTTFPVQFTIQNSDPNISYHYKFFGGIGDIKTQIQTSTNLTYTTSWDSFPIFTTDVGGSAIINTYSYIKPDSSSGSYNLYIKIVKEDNHDLLNVTSGPYIISNVLVPTLTPTLTPTQTPTLTLTPTATPTPTSTPTPTLTPTLAPTSTTKPTPTPTDEPIPTAVIEPLDTTTIAEEIPTPTITQIPAQELILGETTTSKKNPLPLIFICIGGLFLLTPLIISKIKHEN